jgi:hypothetical protein
MIEFKERIGRNKDALPCPKCGGYAERVPLTKGEIKKQICGKEFECCGRAFVCIICNERIIAQADAPEYR